MEYFVFLVLAFLILLVLLLEVGVCIGGVSERAFDKSDSDCIHCSGVPDSSDCNLGERDESIHSGQDIRMDKETAVIALKVIKHDFHSMLSGTEKRAIDFAIDVIRKGKEDD